MSQCVSQWWGKVEKDIPVAVDRIKPVQIENLDCIECIKKYDTPDTLFYLDPPYIHETRKNTSKYNHEMSNEQHRKLVETLLTIKGKAILSGYEHEIYHKLTDSNWTKIFLGEYDKRSEKTTEGESRVKGEEFVWINY